jgi:hypothetical protein
MDGLFRFLFKLFVAAAALVFAVSLAVAGAVAATIWLVRAGVARLTGKPVRPFEVRMNARRGFGPVQRAPYATADVTDVEPRPPRSN